MKRKKERIYVLDEEKTITPYLCIVLCFHFIHRYREKEKEPQSTNKNHELQKHYQQINSHHRNFEEILERDHGLPTSAPNADILKTNSNPMYPNPNRHHNHERHHSGNGPTLAPGNLPIGGSGAGLPQNSASE